MIAIALGQVLMSFNVASLPVAMSGMVKSFSVPPTTVATGIVMYSLAVAGFVMLGAKLNQRYGALNVFRAVVLLFGLAQVLMTFSPNATATLRCLPSFAISEDLDFDWLWGVRAAVS
jgi:MFS family permease